MPRTPPWLLHYGRLAALASVASLGYFGYVFLYEFGPPGTGPGPTTWTALDVAWNVTLFAAFAGHHSVMARTPAKAWMSRLVPPSAERATYAFLAAVTLTVTCWAWRHLAGTVYDLRPPARQIAYFVQAIGLLQLARTGVRMDLAELVGLRQVRSGLVPERPATSSLAPETPTLDCDGPYRLVRHPLYLGGLLLLWGTPTLTVDRLLMCTLVTLYVAVAVRWEERGLEREHGDAYRAYARRVRWRIVPGLY